MPSTGQRRAAATSPTIVPTTLILVGVLLVAGNLRAAITTVGPVLSGIRDDLGLSSSAASFLVSLPLFTFAVVSPLVPRLIRGAGLERTLAVSLVILAAGLVLRSMSPAVLLWVGTVGIGIGIGVLNVVLPAWVKRDFPTKIGQVTGAYAAVQSGFAAVAAGIAVPVAGLTTLGWRLPTGMWAGLALIAVGALVPLLGRRPDARPVTQPVGDIAPSPAAPVTPTGRPLWRSAVTWQVAAFMGLQSTNFYILVTWLSTIETDAGVGETAAGIHQFLLNAVSIVSNLVCSGLIARLRDQRILGAVIPLILLCATLGVLCAPRLSVVWAVLAGAGGGASIVLALSLFGLRTRHHTTAASLSGLAQAVGYLFAAVGPVAFGALHDATGSWTPALIVLVVVDVLMLWSGYLAGRDRTVD
ncbi:CynX/NimT family MFS transporter [Corynebacterium nuruki]|uniref:CynX/NimT family MFS transporter n=1 Tax=Corynebacterium nuruki TaxID=1032851 RepID=UPI0039BFF7C4